MNLIEKNERMKELIEMLNKYRDAYYNQTESLVSDYKDIVYGDSLEATGHHLRSQIAFKFYDEKVD